LCHFIHLASQRRGYSRPIISKIRKNINYYEGTFLAIDSFSNEAMEESSGLAREVNVRVGTVASFLSPSLISAFLKNSKIRKAVSALKGVHDFAVARLHDPLGRYQLNSGSTTSTWRPSSGNSAERFSQVKLNELQRIEARRRLAAGELPVNLAPLYGVSRPTIARLRYSKERS
jgi:hypothetical protein